MILAGLIPNPPARPGPTPGYRRQSSFAAYAKQPPPSAEEGLTGRVLVCLEVLGLERVAGNGGRVWRCRCVAPSGHGGAACGVSIAVAEHDIIGAHHRKGSCGSKRCRPFVVSKLRAARAAACPR